MDTYFILLIGIVAAVAVAGAVFHYWRPNDQRSPELAIAIFSAILAASVGLEAAIDRAGKKEEREAQITAASKMLDTALKTAAEQASARDAALAKQLEGAFRQAGINPPPSIIQHTSRPAARAPVDASSVRRIAELETEKRMRDEQAQRDAEVSAAAHRAGMRQICALRSYKDAEQCRQYQSEAAPK